MSTRNQSKTVLNLVAAIAGLSLTAPLANAAIVQTTAMDDSQTFFDGGISETDLINVGQATLGGFTSSWPAAIGPSDSTGVHNGIGTNNSGLAYWGGSGGMVTLTYTLAGSATGYDLTSINTIYGWNDSRQKHMAQRYNVDITTVTIPTFTSLDAVVFDPYTGGVQASTQVTLTEDTNGVLASGVTAIRFTLFNDPDSPTEVGVVREYDVFGNVTAPIPEPSGVLLLSVAGLGFVLRRRR